MASTKQQENSKKRCLNCAKPLLPEFRPFCSPRCSQLDLSKWLNEDYRLPVVEFDDLDEEEFVDEEY